MLHRTYARLPVHLLVLVCPVLRAGASASNVTRARELGSGYRSLGLRCRFTWVERKSNIRSYSGAFEQTGWFNVLSRRHSEEHTLRARNLPSTTTKPTHACIRISIHQRFLEKTSLMPRHAKILIRSSMVFLLWELLPSRNVLANGSRLNGE
jgi:hypothetical protein